jgi:hypothetical protein
LEQNFKNTSLTLPLYTLGGKVPRQYFIALQHYYLIGDKVANATVYKYIYLTIIKFYFYSVILVVRRTLMCKERFDIVDGDGNGVAMIKGPNCACRCCTEVSFKEKISHKYWKNSWNRISKIQV